MINRKVMLSFSNRQKLAFKECSIVVKKEFDVICCFIFGSAARNNITEKSDLDLIYLIYNNSHFFKYYKTNYNGISIDLNIMSQCTFESKFSTFEWQYRFVDCKIIYDNYKFSEKFPIKLVQQFIISNEAKLNRIKLIFEVIRNNKKILEKYDKFVKFIFFILLETLEKSIFLTLERNNKIPFHSGDPYELLNNEVSVKQIIDLIFINSKNKWKDLRSILNYFLFEFKKNSSNIDLADEDIFKNLNLEVVEKFERNCNLHQFNINFQSINAILDLFTNGNLIAVNNEFELKSIFPKKKVKSSNESSRVVNYECDTKTLKLIIPTGGCKVDSCTFCTLANIATNKNHFNINELIMPYKNTAKILKIYTDGSFFDKRELSYKEQHNIAEIVKNTKVKVLFIESLPMFITEDSISSFIQHLGNNIRLIIGVGLQSINNKIRNDILSSPIQNNEINNILELKQKYNFNLRIYLLYGKPLLTIYEDINDVKNTVFNIIDKLNSNDVITINPLIISKESSIGAMLSCNLYLHHSICLLLKTIEFLIANTSFKNIFIGKIYDNTCVEKEEGTQIICDSCNKLILNSKNEKCITKYFSYIPWNILGDFQYRLSYLKNMS